ncbi:ABC transporter ATP-binding protein [Paenibacillus sp. J22TS3]|uniref:ABC transporter ATP-binding protein n=1 Tax=Paenibacillus sp. J22TS3 TaxID=2807192 RepID=UPI001B0C90E7|nr:ABC transporter ATP-binding protein [Paenibacillus sp. J22TS3]GIP19746.1 ABC transporter ATP-binding protein [Paenibacillus sp. J22TS3]
MLNVVNVDKSYKTGGMFTGKPRKILKNVSFECFSGECLGILGESGSGKSTLGRLLLGLEKPDRGSVLFEGKNVIHRTVRKGKLSAVFQDYSSSIHPMFTVEQAILEPLLNAQQSLSRNEKRSKVDLLLTQVGLDPAYKNKYAHELSGGEAQRVCIARAISTEPRCIVLDEAVSSLNVSVQIQVLKLLKQLKQLYAMSYIFITHDIMAASYICDRILVVKDGQIEESIGVENLKEAQSAYTQRLLKSLISF